MMTVVSKLNTTTKRKRAGRLTIITGPMYSGKTTTLLRHYECCKVAGRKVTLLKPVKDTRHGDNGLVQTHSGAQHEGCRAASIREEMDTLRKMDAVFIDELQFFERLDAWTGVSELLEQGVDVYVAGLDGTYERQPFDQVLMLIPYAHQVTKLVAVCGFCKNAEAPYTYYAKRSDNDKRCIDWQVHVGNDGYTAACEDCYAEKMQ
jgi:thymidine kinase